MHSQVADHSKTASPELMRWLLPALGDQLRSSLRVDLPRLCDEYQLPPAAYEDRFTKRQYVETRLQKITDNNHLRAVAAELARRHPLHLHAGPATYEIEQLLWQDEETAQIPRWIRRILVEVFAHASLDRECLIHALGRVFVLDIEPSFPLLRRDSRAPLQKIRNDYPERPEPWQVKNIFEEAGAFTCDALRFSRLVEVFVASDALPTETTDQLLATSRSALGDTGYKIVKMVRTDDALPRISLDKVSEPISRLNRFRARREAANEYRVLVTYGIVLPSFSVVISLWFILSIAYSILETRYVVAVLALPLVVCSLFLLHNTLRKLRWLWVIGLISSSISLVAFVYGWIREPSQPMWMILTACALVGIIKAVPKRKRKRRRGEGSLFEKLTTLLWTTAFASMGLAVCLFVTAELLGVYWKPISDVSLSWTPPFISI